jgi:hypothetical protein
VLDGAVAALQPQIVMPAHLVACKQ